MAEEDLPAEFTLSEDDEYPIVVSALGWRVQFSMLVGTDIEATTIFQLLQRGMK